MKRTQKVLTLIGVALAATVTLAACSTGSQPETVRQLETDSQSEIAGLSQIPSSEQNEDVEELRQNVELVIGNLPVDFPITIYQGAGYQDGDEVLLSEMLADGKPVVLNFWAGLCPPCRVEMPDLQAVSDEYQDRVLLFGLDVGPFIGLGSTEDGRALLQELSITYPAGTTSNPDVVREYKVLGMPTTYFITPEGEIYETWTGLLTRDKLIELVEELLAA
jgi:thiol-disulfide isomerase/thioredoxin